MEQIKKKSPPILGVIIAGGKSGRMQSNAPKCLLDFNGKSILSHIIDRAKLQVDHLIINANSDDHAFTDTGLTVIPDEISGQQGPLAGMHTAMVWAKENISDDCLIACFASDVPLVPLDYVEKLNDVRNAKDADIAFATSNEKDHPVFVLLPVSLYDDLHKTLTIENSRAIYKWLKKHKTVEVDFQNENGIDPFFNVNTPEDLKTLKNKIALSAPKPKQNRKP